MPTDVGAFPRKPALVFGALALLLLASVLAGLFTGSYGLSSVEILRALARSLGSASDASIGVVWELRVPRVLLALVVGAALASAGAAMQGLFRNPLADPGLIGVSSGAALAAVTMIVAGHRLLPPGIELAAAIPAATFAGGLAATLLAARLARLEGHTHTATLLLAGLAINAIAGAGIGLLTQIAGDVALREATFWLFGSLSRSGWAQIAVCVPLLVLSIVLLPLQARALNALLMGEAEARHVGVDVERLKRRLVLLIVLAVGTSVALTGIIGFIGLIVPHLLRLILGPDHRMLLPATALGGAALLGLADAAARALLAPSELPVGILTALIGGPLFLAMLMRSRGGLESY